LGNTQARIQSGDLDGDLSPKPTNDQSSWLTRVHRTL
jgi:hypothetical protein